jgi:hypothetical protein
VTAHFERRAEVRRGYGLGPVRRILRRSDGTRSSRLRDGRTYPQQVNLPAGAEQRTRVQEAGHRRINLVPAGKPTEPK